MATSTSAPFDTNAIDLLTLTLSTIFMAEREPKPAAQPRDTRNWFRRRSTKRNQSAPLPDWDRFWGDMEKTPATSNRTDRS